MIYRYPRYGELLRCVAGAERLERARRVFGAQDFRDLQVLSQLAWFDEEFQASDPEVRGLLDKGRDFTLDDQTLMGSKQREIVGQVMPDYRKLAARGPDRDLHHAVLPSHPAAAVRFRYRRRVASECAAAAALPLSGRRAQATGDGPRLLHRHVRHGAGRALWPSEGSVSDEVFHIAADTRLPMGRHR